MQVCLYKAIIPTSQFSMRSLYIKARLGDKDKNMTFDNILRLHIVFEWTENFLKRQNKIRCQLRD